jgi:Ser-tRNA(Ala) deacylase AlaX
MPTHLPQQVFHPQGGGQPADTGTISGDGWGFAVEHVTVQKEDNSVEHHGRFVGGGANSSGLVGTAVKLSVDDVSRRLHARLHSAG